MIYPSSQILDRQEHLPKARIYTAQEVERLITNLMISLQQASITIGSNTNIDITHKTDCVGVDVRLQKEDKAIKVECVIERGYSK